MKGLIFQDPNDCTGYYNGSNDNGTEKYGGSNDNGTEKYGGSNDNGTEKFGSPVNKQTDQNKNFIKDLLDKSILD